MQLLSSNVYNILWMGRYLARIQFWCGQVPFQNDQYAERLAKAFYLPAYDAVTLNALLINSEQLCSFQQLFYTVNDNIQALRGVLSRPSYAELNRLFQSSQNNSVAICTAVNEFEQILEGESQDLFVFFSLGQTLERLDHRVRLDEPLNDLIAIMEQLMQLLQDYAWSELEKSWQAFKAAPNAAQFFNMLNQLQRVFEMNV
ncbi:hypothetical protein [Acinetobacter sp. MD2]|uniref:hypothetical protein n=1 Tax=Acinetobacter sp. MD2 TaxID=2600066 RepID=UPI002D1F74B3|nr:hypothetical protein [Acinetobacter sp. MD2]MEB3766342.1 hypothetical protein [Acinetobacter sp. MD2]